jgi:hypothetical protein
MKSDAFLIALLFAIPCLLLLSHMQQEKARLGILADEETISQKAKGNNTTIATATNHSAVNRTEAP